MRDCDKGALLCVEKLETKLPISRVVLGLVECSWLIVFV